MCIGLFCSVNWYGYYIPLQGWIFSKLVNAERSGGGGGEVAMHGEGRVCGRDLVSFLLFSSLFCSLIATPSPILTTFLTPSPSFPFSPFPPCLYPCLYPFSSPPPPSSRPSSLRCRKPICSPEPSSHAIIRFARNSIFVYSKPIFLTR